jgi:soluble lytic murein transglycosylase
VVRWQSAFGALPSDLFVERIPFKETRDYVKRVLTAEAMYRALDGAPLTLDLPPREPPAPEHPTVPTAVDAH